MIQPEKKNSNCVGKSRMFIYLAEQNQLSLSGEKFGIPQIRPRVYIPGIYDPKQSKKPLDLKFGKSINVQNISLESSQTITNCTICLQLSNSV